MYAHYVGLDLGKVQDYTALAILQQHHAEGQPARYTIPWLQRWKLGTEYHTVVSDVADIIRKLASQKLGGIALIVDMTGVGQPVVELLRREPMPADLYDVTITGGDAPSHEEKSWRVPKRDLVSTVQVLVQPRPSRLTIAPALPDAATLQSELLNFQVKITDTAHDTYGAWREGTHDDLVLAAALAAWAGEQDGIPEIKGPVALPTLLGVKVPTRAERDSWTG